MAGNMEMQLPKMEERLQKRYVELVKAHQQAATRTAAGPSHKPQEGSQAKQRQGAWRFFRNPRVTLGKLIEPLRALARLALGQSKAPCALLVHDWSKLDYKSHESKKDKKQLTHEDDIGYDLATALLVSAEDGSTIAPMDLHIETADAVHSTRVDPPPAVDVNHLEQILPAMEASKTWDLPCQLVHIIDREADSVGHYRQWDEAGHLFLVRGDDRLVMWRERECHLTEVVATLEEEGAFHQSREVLYQGKKAWQEVAETQVVLHRPAKHRQDGKQIDIPGKPLELRLVIARVRSQEGELLSTWLLLSNVPLAMASAMLLALWYYWRWKIETYHKLLKSLGQEIEFWQQETGVAIAKRLLVAAMACTITWQLARATDPQANTFRRILIELSGRAMKFACPFTVPALLAGLHVFVAFLALLDRYSIDSLRSLASLFLPFFSSA